MLPLNLILHVSCLEKGLSLAGLQIPIEAEVQVSLAALGDDLLQPEGHNRLLGVGRDLLYCDLLERFSG